MKLLAWICPLAIGVIAWLTLNIKSTPELALCNLSVSTDMPGSLARSNFKTIWWSMDQHGQIFEQDSNPIWRDQLGQILVDEKHSCPSYRVALAVHPSCCIEPVLAFIAICSQHQAPVSVYLQPKDPLHASRS